MLKTITVAICQLRQHLSYLKINDRRFGRRRAVKYRRGGGGGGAPGPKSRRARAQIFPAAARDRLRPLCEADIV